MCGFVGIASSSNDQYIDQTLIGHMTDSLYHRGPDDYGYHFDGGIGMGFRRLSIIDLDLGHQPMSNEDGTIWICFNGEIYNFQILRNRLTSLGHHFKTNSDTEVMIHAYEQWGIEAVEHLNGMFSIALWDSVQNKLLLFRDRMGVKPVYWTVMDNCLVFASEVKSILKYPGVERRANVDALSSYLTFRHAVGDMTFFQEIRKLLPGNYLEFHCGNVKIEEYYSLPVNDSCEDLGEEHYLESTHQLLKQSVEGRMISDVPLGAYLSGGLDSSILVALMSSIQGERPKTFSVGYEEDEYNEESYAKIVSRHCQTDHHQIMISSTNYIDTWPQLVHHRDAPLSIPHEIALYQMSVELKKKVTVVLSGEGADELFGGYGRVQRSPMDWKKIAVARKAMSPFVADVVSSKFPKGSFAHSLGFRSHLEHFFDVYNWMPFEEKWDLFSQDAAEIINKDEKTIKIFRDLFQNTEHINPYDRILHVFQKVHLGCLLERLDMMSMAASVEARVPFVDDHNLVEHVIGIPYYYKMKWKSGLHKLMAIFHSSFEASEWLDTNKYLLRKMGSTLLPSEIAGRRKLGFPTPLDSWLSDGMLGHAKEILLDDMAVSRGLFDQNKIERYLNNPQDLPYDFFGKKIWMLMNIELWFRDSGAYI